LSPQTSIGFESSDSLTDHRPLGYPTSLHNVPSYFLYFPSSYLKEEWHIALRRASQYDPDFPFSISPQVQLRYTSAMHQFLTHFTTTNGGKDVPGSWFNAIIGRAIVGIHGHPALRHFFLKKIRRKLSLLTFPSFLSEIKVDDLEIGTGIPLFTHPVLESFTEEGEVIVHGRLDYNGGFRINISTIATLAITAGYFRPLSIPLKLSLSVLRLSGNVTLKIKPYPETSRLWLSFDANPSPELDLELCPVIGDTEIRFGMLHLAIEKKIREMVWSSLVGEYAGDDWPFWEGKMENWEGGLFYDTENENETTKPKDEALSKSKNISPTSIFTSHSTTISTSAEKATNFLNNNQSPTNSLSPSVPEKILAPMVDPLLAEPELTSILNNVVGTQGEKIKISGVSDVLESVLERSKNQSDNNNIPPSTPKSWWDILFFGGTDTTTFNSKSSINTNLNTSSDLKKGVNRRSISLPTAVMVQSALGKGSQDCEPNESESNLRQRFISTPGSSSISNPF